MNRTDWPLLNRARLHGIYRRGLKSVSPFDPQLSLPGKDAVQPVHIGYAWETEPPPPAGDLPEQFEDVKKLFDGTRIAPPFASVWHEWAETYNGDDPTCGPVDCFILAAQNGGRVMMIGGWSPTPWRMALRDRPALPLFDAVVDLRWFEDGFEELRNGVPINIWNPDDVDELGITKAKAASQCASLCWSVYWSWLLMSCGNVDTIETFPAHRTRKRQKDPSRVVCRELLVDVPPGPRKQPHGTEEDDAGHGVAFHVRRGHFRDYTKGKGLFGKYKKRFWFGPTTVGDPDYGTVTKSYRINQGPS